MAVPSLMRTPAFAVYRPVGPLEDTRLLLWNPALPEDAPLEEALLSSRSQTAQGEPTFLVGSYPKRLGRTDYSPVTFAARGPLLGIPEVGLSEDQVETELKLLHEEADPWKKVNLLVDGRETEFFTRDFSSGSARTSVFATVLGDTALSVLSRGSDVPELASVDASEWEQLWGA